MREASGFFAERLSALGVGKTASRWHVLLALATAFGILAGGIYLTAGLGQWSPSFTPMGKVVRLSLAYIMFPALVEELCWRWLLIPPRSWRAFGSGTVYSILLSAGVATAAHPLVAWGIAPQAREVFCNPFFLLIVFLLGLFCGTMYVVARSIWPPVALHWFTIVNWKFLFDGPLLFFQS